MSAPDIQLASSSSSVDIMSCNYTANLQKMATSTSKLVLVATGLFSTFIQLKFQSSGHPTATIILFLCPYVMQLHSKFREKNSHEHIKTCAHRCIFILHVPPVQISSPRHPSDTVTSLITPMSAPFHHPTSQYRVHEPVSHMQDEPSHRPIDYISIGPRPHLLDTADMQLIETQIGVTD